MVFPEPRKPVRIVIGIGDIFGGIEERRGGEWESGGGGGVVEGGRDEVFFLSRGR